MSNASRFTDRRMHPLWNSNSLPNVPKTSVRDEEMEEAIIWAMVDVVESKLDEAVYLHLFNNIARNDYNNSDAVEFVDIVGFALGNARRYSQRDVEKLANEARILLAAKFAVDCPDLMDLLEDRDYNKVNDVYDNYLDLIDKMEGGRSRGRDRGTNRRDRGVSSDTRGGRSRDRVQASGGSGNGRMSEVAGRGRRTVTTAPSRQNTGRVDEVVEEYVEQQEEPQVSARDVLYKGGNPDVSAFHAGRDNVTYTRVGGEVKQSVIPGFKVDYNLHKLPYDGVFANRRRVPTPESDQAINSLARHTVETVQTKEPGERFVYGSILISENDVVEGSLIDAITQARVNRVNAAADGGWPGVYVSSWYNVWKGFVDLPEKEIATAQYILDTIHGDVKTLEGVVEKYDELPAGFADVLLPRLEKLTIGEVNRWLANMSLDINITNMNAVKSITDYLEQTYGEQIGSHWKRGIAKQIELFFNPTVRPLVAIPETGIDDATALVPKTHVELVQLNRLIIVGFTGRELCLEIPDTGKNLPVHMTATSHPELTEIFNAVLDAVVDANHTYRTFVVTSDGYVVELMRSWVNMDKSFLIRFLGLVA